MGCRVTTIAGMSVGFELIDRQTAEYLAQDGKWGIGIDLLIFRILLIVF